MKHARLLALALAALPFPALAEQADLLLVNGKVLTVNLAGRTLQPGLSYSTAIR